MLATRPSVCGYEARRGLACYIAMGGMRAADSPRLAGTVTTKASGVIAGLLGLADRRGLRSVGGMTVYIFIFMLTSDFIASDASGHVNPRHEREATDYRHFRRVCYIGGWGLKRHQAEARLTIDDIDPFLCTHIIYAFAKVSVDDLNITASEWDDESSASLVGTYETLNRLKEQNPRLQTILSIGGASAGGSTFQAITKSKENIDTFATNARDYLERWDFNGLDIDWEFPTDYRKFNDLLQGLRVVFDAHRGRSCGTRLLLTVAVGVSEKYISEGYDIKTISRTVDFISLMTYDFHGSWDRFTGGNAPLLARIGNEKFNPANNVNWAVKRWLQGGAAKRKLVVGLSAQARTFTLAKDDKMSVGAPAVGPGLPGKYTQIQGTLAYFEVCDKFSSDSTRRWDSRQKFPFAIRGNQWVSYDNPRSIAMKAAYVVRHSLGGAMIWSLDIDDFKGDVCGQGPFPLTSAMKDILTGNRFVDMKSPLANMAHVSTKAITVGLSYMVAVFNIAVLFHEGRELRET